MELHPIAFRFTQDFSEAAFDWLFPFLVVFIAKDGDAPTVIDK